MCMITEFNCYSVDKHQLMYSNFHEYLWFDMETIQLASNMNIDLVKKTMAVQT